MLHQSTPGYSEADGETIAVRSFWQQYLGALEDVVLKDRVVGVRLER